MAGKVGSVPGVTTALPTSVVQARAVDAQAKVTGGALNASAQSSVQSNVDKTELKRQAHLLGHDAGIDPAHALEPTHTATGEDARSPTERPGYLFRRRQRPGQGHGQQHHGEQTDDQHPGKLPEDELELLAQAGLGPKAL